MRTILLSTLLAARAFAQLAEYVAPSGNFVEGRYVVTLQNGHSEAQHIAATGLDFSQARYGYALVDIDDGDYIYFANLTDEERDDKVRRDPGVALVVNEMMGEVFPSDDESETTEWEPGNFTVEADRGTYFIHAWEYGSNYGQPQVSMGYRTKDTPIPDMIRWDYFQGGGFGVDIYILDTGVNPHHTFLTATGLNRLHHLAPGDSPGSFTEFCNGKNYVGDIVGHGTHIASIAAGIRLGIAQNATVWNVKMACAGRGYATENLVKAINAVKKRHKERLAGEDRSTFRGSVINMSLGSDTGNAKTVAHVQRTLDRAWDAGVVLVSAAGQIPYQGKDAKDMVPCNNPNVMCVSATNREYGKYFSANYGPTVDYLAPGASILGASHSSSSQIVHLSGTSQATAFLSGISALFLSWEALRFTPEYTRQRVDQNIVDNCCDGWPAGTPLKLVNTGFGNTEKASNIPYLEAPVQPATGWPYPPGAPSPGDPDPGDAGQQIAFASYINPIGDPDAWKRLLGYDSNKLTVLVANVLNGPDYVVEPNWASVIQQAAGRGKTIIGYVRTGYLGVSQQKFTTRLGSNDLADWASQIEQDIDKWYELYPGNLGGIFFDEGWPECGPNNIYADLYKHINDYTKRKYPGAYTVLNPGSPIASCYEDTMDTLLTFESSYETYLNAFVPNDWVPKDPRKIWHIIYKTPQDQIASVTQLARERSVGLVEVTDDVSPNPYDNLPNEAYMQAAMDALSGGKLRKDEPAQVTGSYVAGLPGDARVAASDYSSVTITWSSVAGALGYAVYMNGKLALELPASLNRATIGMIDPGTKNLQFEVRTLLSSGGGGTSNILNTETPALPGGSIIENVNMRIDSNTAVYTADILVPYAFVRLFIAGSDQPKDGFASGWPIVRDPAIDNYHLTAKYLVEGNDFYSGLYKYSGAYVEMSPNNADWSWNTIGTAPQTLQGKHIEWRVPLEGNDAEITSYVVQGQGYAPLTNVFKGKVRRCFYSANHCLADQ